MFQRTGKIALAPDSPPCDGAERKRCSWIQCYRPFIIVLAFFAIGYGLKTSVIPAIGIELDRYKDDQAIPHLNNLELGVCANWTIEGNTASAEIQMELGSPEIRFFTQGSLPNGDITFVQSKRRDTKAIITVHTVFSDPKFLKYVSACLAEYRSGRESTTPALYDSFAIRSVPWLPRQQGSFSVLVDLPTTDQPSLHFERFTSQMVNFAHTFEYLPTLDINNVWVYTTERPVVAKYLAAKEIMVSTKNAPIQGTFNASHALHLETENSDIDINLNLHNVDPSKGRFCNIGICNEDGRLRATLKTTKGHIRVNANLTTELASGGKFEIEAETSRGMVDFNFVDAPTNSNVWLKAKTLYDRINVALHPTYEGKFFMNALYPFRELLDNRGQDDYPEDPTGQSRPRILWNYYEGLFKQEGAIVWGRGGHDNGGIVMTATGGSTKLVF